MKPSDLEDLLKVCIKYGVQQLELESLKMVINPTLPVQQRLSVENMDKKELEELLYASS